MAERFRQREPGCRAEFCEVRPAEVLPWLREGEVDVVPAGLPLEAPDLVTGPVLVREPRLSAVAAGHPFPRREPVVTADLARVAGPVARRTRTGSLSRALGGPAGAADGRRRGGRAAGGGAHPAVPPAAGRRLRADHRRAPWVREPARKPPPRSRQASSQRISVGW
ncbi:LysR family transcriptional regulator substrate-binding protein [Amycolatopsis sp. FBCC-B4732]|uniref:LysR family transcriptional regulator substrate-binding protein n=1 Tax=Amycolatopsis sp. FBCC-B4732 TaxID=3079339 RepID=UPI0037C00D50